MQAPKLSANKLKAFLDRQSQAELRKKARLEDARRSKTAREEKQDIRAAKLAVSRSRSNEFYARQLEWANHLKESNEAQHVKRCKEEEDHPFFPSILKSFRSPPRCDPQPPLEHLEPLKAPGESTHRLACLPRAQSPLSSEPRPRSNSAVAVGIDRAEEALAKALKLAMKANLDIVAAKKELLCFVAGKLKNKRVAKRNEEVHDSTKSMEEEGVPYWSEMLENKLSEEPKAWQKKERLKNQTPVHEKIEPPHGHGLIMTFQVTPKRSSFSCSPLNIT